LAAGEAMRGPLLSREVTPNTGRRAAIGVTPNCTLFFEFI
jgi:hypothetical protein